MKLLRFICRDTYWNEAILTDVDINYVDKRFHSEASGELNFNNFEVCDLNWICEPGPLKRA